MSRSKTYWKYALKRLIFVFLIGFILIFALFVNILGPWTFQSKTKGPYLSWSGHNPQTSMTITWETPLEAITVLEYGYDESYGFTYYDDEKTTLHVVELTHLEPGTTYHYRVLAPGYYLGEMSEDNYFTTAPAREVPFSFVVYGDNRDGFWGRCNHQSVVDKIIEYDPDLVWNVGDIVLTGTRNYAYDHFFHEIKDLAKNTPYFVSIGNHELAEQGGTHDEYFHYFHFPGNEWWYSIDYANAHFVAINVSWGNPFVLCDEMLEWLESDLKNTEADWKFVFFHYPCFDTTAGFRENLTKTLVPIFEEYDVDIVFQGHDHYYERIIYNGKHYIVTGGGGAELDTSLITERIEGSQSLHFIHHFVYCEIDGKSLQLQSISVDGTILDTLTIDK